MALAGEMEIMEKIDFTDPGLEPKDVARFANVRHNVHRNILNLQAKVEEMVFRRKQADIMPKILEVLAREKARLVSPTDAS